MVTIVGTDEAGRGPVIGPLILAGVLIEEKDEQQLIDLGVKDSKLLTPQQREKLFEEIPLLAKDHLIITVPPKEIDEALAADDSNLNWLEADKTAEIIRELRPQKAIVDCPSNNIEAYTTYLKKLVPNVQLVVEHKADLNYPSAAAASILAKVTRDQEIEKLKRKLNVDFGSGYPADPKTASFLQKNYKKYPDIFRKTWASYKKLVKDESQGRLTDF